MTTRRLTIYLLKNVSKISDALAKDRSPSSRRFKNSSGLSGVFYYTSSSMSEPSWSSFIKGAVNKMPNLITSSASGLLVVEVAKEFFAIPFGYGKSFLNPSKIVHQFGLRVALNVINAQQIRSMDTKIFEDLVVARSTQASKSSELPTFGIDISRDILRAVTGEPSDKKFGKRISGSDAIVVNRKMEIEELPTFCEDLLEAYKKTTYKENFEWIDHLALVVDADLVMQLDAKLETQLKKGDTSSTHMAMPETIAWEDVDAFRIAGTGDQEYEDLDLDDYLDRLGENISKITIARLKTRQVSVGFHRSESFDARWSVYQCIITEQYIENNLFVLIEGRWFVVSPTLAAAVDKFATSHSDNGAKLIAAVIGEREDDYNKRLTESMGNGAICFDARIKRPGGAASGIELCDVFTDNGEFIHVKRKSRSSTLSHLFAQGSVSATAFIADGIFRNKIRDVIKSSIAGEEQSKWLSLVPPDGKGVDRSKYKVSYLVIANTLKSDMGWLPFFSKLNLMQHGRQLESLGFDVSISRIDSKVEEVENY